MRHAHSSSVSGTDERMDGEEKRCPRGVWRLPLVPLDLYQLVSYLFLEPQCNPGKPGHVSELKAKMTKLGGGYGNQIIKR